jgi:hypothetical protein
MEETRSIVQAIMAEFAASTGLSPVKDFPTRYLWTDAFAVCNFLELFRQTGDEEHKILALRLVDQVHQTLGRHREDDPRTGWISGLDEQEGKRHPTIGGLRIGKKLNERGPRDTFDESLEWDRDGQYFHYLTKWMHALNRVSRVTGDLTYNRWAIELAETAHARFTYVPPYDNRKRMYWKMSIDLSYPLVQSMGQHDPLDALITYSELRMTPPGDIETPGSLDIAGEIRDLTAICEGKSWVTDDPLGLGGLLADAFRVGQLVVNSIFEPADLLQTILASSQAGLQSYTTRRNPLNLPADYRLAFRELGLSIGLRAIERLKGLIKENQGFFPERESLLSRIENLMQYTPLTDTIEKFWLDPANKEAETWSAHRDINMVTLATSLAPDGYLEV